MTANAASTSANAARRDEASPRSPATTSTPCAPKTRARTVGIADHRAYLVPSVPQRPHHCTTLTAGNSQEPATRTGMDLDSSAIGSDGTNGLCPCIRMPPPSPSEAAAAALSRRGFRVGIRMMVVNSGFTHSLQGGPHGTVPALGVDLSAPTRTLRTGFAQIVGKVRLASSPRRNHWWNVPCI